MPNTFIKIQTITVGVSGASTIVFSSIPQTFTDLKIVLSARSSAANFYTNVVTTINSQSSGSWRTVYGFNGSATSGTSTTIFSPIINAATSTTSVFGNAELYFTNYTTSNAKAVSSDAVVESNTSTNYILGLDAVSITNGTAINTITLTSDFVQYSTATLYGIKSS